MVTRRQHSGNHPVEALPGPQPEHLWDVGETAAFIRKSCRGVYKMVERRQIPYLKIGAAVRFDPAEIRAWVHQYAVPPDPGWIGH